MPDLDMRGEDGGEREPGQIACEEHPTNDTLQQIGAFDRTCKVGKHQATNWVHLKQTVDALDAAGYSEAADTLIWQVWHRVNSRARYQEFYNLGTAAEDAAETKAANLEDRVTVLEEALRRAAETLGACSGVLSNAGETVASMEATAEEAFARAALTQGGPSAD